MKEIRDALFYLAGIVLSCSIAIAVLYAIYCTVTWTWIPEHFMAILLTILIVSVPLFILGGIIHLLRYLPDIVEKCVDYPKRKMTPLEKKEDDKPGPSTQPQSKVEEKKVVSARVEENLAYIGILPWLGSFLGSEVATVVFSDGTIYRRVLPNGWEKGSNVLTICHVGNIVWQLQTASEVDKMLETIQGKSRQARSRKLARMIDSLPQFQISPLAERYLDKLAYPKDKQGCRGKTEIFIEQQKKRS